MNLAGIYADMAPAKKIQHPLAVKTDLVIWGPATQSQIEILHLALKVKCTTQKYPVEKTGQPGQQGKLQIIQSMGLDPKHQNLPFKFI